MDKSFSRKLHLTTKQPKQQTEGIILDDENIRDLRAKQKEDDCGEQTDGNVENYDLNRKTSNENDETKLSTASKTDLEAVKSKYVMENDTKEGFITDRGLFVKTKASNDTFETEEKNQDDANDDEYGDRDNSDNSMADNEDVNKCFNKAIGSDGNVEECDENEFAVSRTIQHLSRISDNEEPQSEFYTFSAKLRDELDCLLTGVIILGNFILVADNENKNVKRFSFQGSFIDYIVLDDPCGMCVLHGGTDFAVTQPDCLKVTIVLANIPLRRKCDISTEKRYDCIASLSDCNLVCGCCKVGKTCVDIINLKGEVLISHREREDGSKLFRNPAAIATVQTGEIIVSDSGSNRLVVLTKDGSIHYFFETTGRPSGVAVDACGCAFVAHFDGNTVLRYSPDGSKEDLLTKWDMKVKSPLALTLNSKYMVLTEEMPSDRVIVLLLPSCPVMDTTSELEMSGIHLWVKQA